MPRRKNRGSAPKEPSRKKAGGDPARVTDEVAPRKTLSPARPPIKKPLLLWACFAMFAVWLVALVLLAVWS